jgi:hypothetical protein
MIKVMENERDPVYCRNMTAVVEYIEDRACELWGHLLDPNQRPEPMPALDWRSGAASFTLPSGREHIWIWRYL